MQWCSGKFGTVGTLGSLLPFIPLPRFVLSLPFAYLPALPYLVAIISMIFLKINLP